MFWSCYGSIKEFWMIFVDLQTKMLNLIQVIWKAFHFRNAEYGASRASIASKITITSQVQFFYSSIKFDIVLKKAMYFVHKNKLKLGTFKDQQLIQHLNVIKCRSEWLKSLLLNTALPCLLNKLVQYGYIMIN